MDQLARRIRVNDHLFQNRFFCNRACAATWAITQAADQLHRWCPECQAWASEDKMCLCEQAGLLDRVETNFTAAAKVGAA